MAFPANTALLKQGFQLMTSLREKLTEKREARESADYEELRQAALSIENLRDRVAHLDEEGRRALQAAGPLTQSARLRLAAAREDIDGSVSDWLQRASEAADQSSTRVGKAVTSFRRNPKKTSKRVARRAEQAAQKVTDKMTGKAARRAERRQKLRAGGLIAGGVALLAAAGGVTYYVITNRRRSPVLDTPPRVEEHSGERQSELVYSTTTEDIMSTDDMKNDVNDTTAEQITYPTADAPASGDATSTEVESAERNSAAEEATKEAAGERVEDTNVYDHAGETAAQPADADAAEEAENREEMEKHKKNM